MEIYSAQSKSVNPMMYAGFVVFCAFLLAPTFIYGLSMDFLKMLFVNLIFIVIIVAYFMHFFTQMKKETVLISGTAYYSDLTLCERHTKRPDMFKSYSLTERELEIAKLLSEGLGYKEIATQIFLEPVTIRTHALHIYTKTGIDGNQKLMKFREKFGTNINSDQSRESL